MIGSQSTHPVSVVGVDHDSTPTLKGKIMTVTEITKPAIPENDEGVKIADAVDRALLLLTAATTLPATEREALDQRAFHQLARHFVETQNSGKVDFWVETLPAYTQKAGKGGSLRYTKQRAALLVGIAEANGVIAELAYTGYSYPNPKTKRRNYFVNIWGDPTDVARVLAVFRALQARLIRDAYAIEMEANLPPADQTRVRRAFCAEFADHYGEALEKVLGQMIEHRNRTTRVQERRLLAEEAQRAHHERVGDKETVDSTTE